MNKLGLYLRRYAGLLASRVRRFVGARRKRGSHERMHILYVTERIEVEHQQAARYRIYNVREALKGRVSTSFEILENGIYRDESNIARADILVLMRVKWSPMTESLVGLAKKHNITIIYDADDLIFLEDYAEKFCVTLPDEIDREQELIKIRQAFGQQEQTFRCADFATASTPYITAVMQAAGKDAFTIHNSLNRRQLRIADRVPMNPKRDTRYISYLSGSVTHNQDFLKALPALTRIFEECPDVKLNIVGYLDTGRLPEVFQGRVRCTPFMPWTRLLRLSAESYINIAPLDLNNPYCHAKSELKFFESAIVGVPTVASATDTYQRCIEHGVNGMLAANEEEWYKAIKSLLDDVKLYESVRYNGFNSVMTHYSPEALANEAFGVYEAVWREKANL